MWRLYQLTITHYLTEVTMVLPCLCTALNVRYNNVLQTKAETPNESQINWRQREHFMKTFIS